MIIYSIVLWLTFLVGGGFIIKWLAETSLGTKSLDSAPPRPNFMPYYFPFAVLLGWLALASLGSSIADSLTSELTDWRQKFATFSFFFTVEVVAVFFIIFSAQKYFVNGLKSFGIRAKDVFQDLISSTGVFIIVWPFVTLSLALVVMLGEYFLGSDFQMQKNEGLAVLLEYKQISLRVLMIVFAAGLTPIFEELVFRGLLQTYFRENLGYKPWMSIFMVSAIFSVLHPLMHLPAIFILSVAMGYVYEKSGSLLRSIFIHCIFNSSQIALALLLQS
ncbi:MAG: CPBP family intramembrane metalloprotease [Planctomycetaceae bacterium]|nr:CPBP family intramembrane metalloprotease [Planctomycetaceae bacterium]